MFQRETAGTTHTLAPEALRAQDAADSSVEQADWELDYRAIDVYAYGILLCSLWDADEDQNQRRHIPLPPGSENLSGHDLERAMSLACKHHVGDTKTYEPHGLRPAIPKTWKVDPKDGMPSLFVDLMQECWRYDPDMRPSFSGICKHLKKELRNQASLGLPLPPAVSPPASERLRVVLNVSYNPKMAWGQRECVFTLAVTLENHGTPMKLTDGVAGEVTTYAFPFLVCAGESVSLHLTHSFFPGDEPKPEVAWVGDVRSAVLLTNIQASAAPQVLPPRVVQLMPSWNAPGALKAALGGTPVALQVKVVRTAAADTTPKERNLGVLQVEVLPKDGVARTSSARRMTRMSTLLREECNWRDCQVFVSYRETETGLKGSNFAFRLQEALEAAGYSVFCYGALLKAGQRWQSPFTDGVQVCQAFIPICSPEYGDLDQAPWSAAELLQAVREQERKGLPHIIPIRHHGRYPPSAEINVIAGLGKFDCVPDQHEYRKTPEARRMKLHDVFELVIARLEDAGVRPNGKLGADVPEDMQQ